MPARAPTSGIPFVFFVQNAAGAPRRHRRTASAGAEGVRGGALSEHRSSPEGAGSLKQRPRGWGAAGMGLGARADPGDPGAAALPGHRAERAPSIPSRPSPPGAAPATPVPASPRPPRSAPWLCAAASRQAQPAMGARRRASKPASPVGSPGPGSADAAPRVPGAQRCGGAY